MDYIIGHVTSKEDARRHVFDLVIKRGIHLPLIKEIEESSISEEKSDEEAIAAIADIADI